MAVEKEYVSTESVTPEARWWWPIRQHRWIIGASVAVVLVCFAVLPFVLDPLFDSHALVEVRTRQDQRSGSVDNPETQRRLLMTTQLQVANGLTSVADLKPYTYVEVLPDTQLLAIHFQAPRADLARDGANTVAQAFVRHTALLRDQEIEDAAQLLASEIASINGASVFQMPEILDLRSSPLLVPDSLDLGSQSDGDLSAFRSGALDGSLGSQLESGLVSQFLGSYDDAMSRLVQARIMNPAFLPDEPVPRLHPLVIALFVLLAAAIPAGCVVLRNQMRETLDYPSDVTRLLGYPCLGVLPAATRRAAHKLCLDVAYRGAFDHVMADFNLRRPVKNELTQFDEGRITMVGSSHKGEGKTSVATNVALALSKNESVLLINADMRTSLGIMGLPEGAAGLSHLIAGAAQMRDCIHRPAGQALDVMPAGVLPPNPAELLSAPRFVQILASLRRRYKTIILDSPDLHSSVDGLFLVQHCDDIVYVVVAGQSRTDETKVNLQKLHKRGASIAGVVMNECKNQMSTQTSELRAAT